MNHFLLNPPRRILLVKPSSMGDVIHALPVVAALHEAWPEAEIRWLIQPAWRDLVVGHPAIRETISFPREHFRGFFGWIKSLLWARNLRVWKPDLAIDLQGLLRSALMARFSGASFVLGLSDAREGASLFYSATAAVDKKEHAVRRYLRILELLNIEAKAPQFTFAESRLPVGFSANQRFVVIHPYARGKGKSLTREQVLALTKSLGEVRVILVGQGEEMKQLSPNVSDWSGRTTLLELIAILRQASFIVSSDSGPMHLAAALHPCETLAIHRWSDPLRVGPWHSQSSVWKNGVITSVDQLTEESRVSGRTPTLEEMKEIGKYVLEKIEAPKEK